jgi:hypothetical protein
MKKNPTTNCEIFNEQLIGLILNMNEFFLIRKEGNIIRLWHLIPALLALQKIRVKNSLLFVYFL